MTVTQQNLHLTALMYVCMYACNYVSFGQGSSLLWTQLTDSLTEWHTNSDVD